jgi:site-specific DNA-methyltransferase (adenine-specific)
MRWNIYHGENIEVMKKMPSETYTSIITDPPYGISFMGKDWDKALPDKDTWKQLLRVTKKGGVLIAFGAPRMYHRLAVDIEDAGWEIKDCMMWIYGQGFPKSYNISKGIDKRLGTERVTIGRWKPTGTARPPKDGKGHSAAISSSVEEIEKDDGQYIPITTAGSPEAKEFEGFGTNLKPAWEPILIAMKPVDKTFVDNALNVGISGFNIDEARLETKENLDRARGYTDKGFMKMRGGVSLGSPKGRYPSNLIFSHHEKCTEKRCIALCPTKLLDKQAGNRKSGGNVHGAKAGLKFYSGEDKGMYEQNFSSYKDSGGASRFFYCTKPSQSSREGYLNHPTLKPIGIMEYLIKLIKQPKGRTKILDPFGGSGTTLAAALRNNVDCDTIEREQEYVDMIRKRYVKELKMNSTSRFDKKSKNKELNRFKNFSKKKNRSK